MAALMKVTSFYLIFMLDVHNLARQHGVELVQGIETLAVVLVRVDDNHSLHLQSEQGAAPNALVLLCVLAQPRRVPKWLVLTGPVSIVQLNDHSAWARELPGDCPLLGG